MRRARAIIYILTACLLLFAACTEAPTEPPKEKEADKPVEPVDGQTAFYRMFTASRGWSQDSMGLRLESINLKEVPSKDGLYGAWRASFYSPSKGKVAVFNYSVVEVGGKIQKGVFQDHEEGYSEGRTQPWNPTALKASSVMAVEVAKARKEAKEYMRKNPDVPIFMLCEQTHRHPGVAWRVVWGESVSRSGFSVFVDASTGKYLEVMR